MNLEKGQYLVLCKVLMPIAQMLHKQILWFWRGSTKNIASPRHFQVPFWHDRHQIDVYCCFHVFKMKLQTIIGINEPKMGA